MREKVADRVGGRKGTLFLLFATALPAFPGSVAGSYGLLLGLALKKYPKAAGLEDLKARDGDRIRKGLYLKGKKDFGAEAKALLKAAYAEA